ncbi:hypothetical protein LINGRAHAP2_LOCUS10858 [Linum grandiflorum]
MKKLKAALVAQFVGVIPPIHVIAAMVNRLWGYEGEVCVSKLPEDLCLIEFASVRLSEWVLARNVPPQLVTNEGVGWLVSSLG